jgi:hypothetical protein
LYHFKRILFLTLALILTHPLISQESIKNKSIGKSFSYTKWGAQHGLNFLFQKENIILSYELGVNINTSYLQNRFRPTNQLGLGYDVLKESELFSLSPLLALNFDTYLFNPASRINMFSYQAGYLFFLGKKKLRLFQSSFIGWGSEYHWEGERNKYIDYKLSLGLVYEL